jgi:hypothetical protein
MTYTEKMHKATRKQNEGKRNIITDLLDEIERLQKEAMFWKKESFRRESAEFWLKDVYPDGITAEKIENELLDYYVILENVSKVYDHITGGIISKQNTLAEEVNNAADNFYRELYEENQTEI